ncbi:hypothetical protein ZOSMA_24G00910 [Zostera marina]|uniref:Uncharacterized protein n=1 Tax=Zostera marina TaxID=29655 RepID=A0A0K9PG67_ZOSMR|nr:hypothetical protein ZOSMA_24G00910 [Zostera marina]
MDVGKLLEGARSGDTSQLKSLLNRPDVENICKPVDAGRNNVLHIAAKYCRTNYADEFISFLNNPTLLNHLLIQPNCKGNTPLQCAVLAGKPDFVSLLLPKMDDFGIEKKNHHGNTALHLAASGVSNDDLEIVNMLVKKCESVGLDRNNIGKHPLYIAAERGSLKITKCLLKFRYFPATLIGKTAKSTALHAAVARGDNQIFEEVLK